MVKIRETIAFVTRAHADQKYGDMPFMVHPLRVMSRFTDPILQTVALLHDVVEDTAVTLDELRELYSTDIVEAVEAITRRDGEDYLDEYIPRVARNKLAVQVKRADLLENMFFGTMVYAGDYDDLVKRYAKALDLIMPGWNNHREDDVDGLINASRLALEELVYLKEFADGNAVDTVQIENTMFNLDEAITLAIEYQHRAYMLDLVENNNMKSPEYQQARANIKEWQALCSRLPGSYDWRYSTRRVRTKKANHKKVGMYKN